MVPLIILLGLSSNLFAPAFANNNENISLCLYKPESPSTQATNQSLCTSFVDDSDAVMQRRRNLGEQADGGTVTKGQCYLNPMVVAAKDLPDANTPIQKMLLKTAWTAYQCSFVEHKGRCGTYRHPPYDCRWVERDPPAEDGKCTVTPEYLLPRLLAYLHCRDNATITPFWNRCYTVGLLTDDSDWCGQPDGNWARCWWFPARNGRNENDICAPSLAGGVANREKYDKLVTEIVKGKWEKDWFGQCLTAELVYNITSACKWAADDTCEGDSCILQPDAPYAPYAAPGTCLPVQYGRCRLTDEKIWDMIIDVDKKSNGSTLVEDIKERALQCNAASSSTCLSVGTFNLDPDKFSDVIDLVFLEEISESAAAPRVIPSLPLLVAVLTAAALVSRVLRETLSGPWGPSGVI